MSRAVVSSSIVALTLVAAGAGAAQQRAEITVGHPVHGALAAGDATLASGEFMDAYAFAGRAGQRIVIRLSSTAFDAYLMIRGPSDFAEANDDEASGSNNARLEVRLPADGTYRIVATSFRPGESGEYDLDVSEAGAAPPAAPGGAPAAGQQRGGPIAVGQTVRGTLAPGDETLRTGEFADTWRLAGRRGARITVRLEGADFDSYLLVRGPGGFSEDNDDDPTERGSTHSRLDLTLPADGEYRIVATSYRAGESGAYSLSVAGEQAAPPAAAPVAAAGGGAIAVGQTVSGRLASGDPQLRSGEYFDAYTLAGTRGQQLEIRLVSGEFDPYVQITGPGGFSAYNDDDVDGGSNNSHLVVALPADGTYRIVATSYRAGESGLYQLSVGTTSAVATGAGAGAAAATGGRAGAVTLALGQAVGGALRAGDDTLQTGEFVDRYTFTGHRGQRVGIDFTSRAFDAYLILVAPSGHQEENDDYRANVTDSRIETELQEEGTYTVMATTYRRGETGLYQLTPNPVTEGARAATAAGSPAAAAAGAVALAAGASQTGRLQAGDSTLRTGEFADRYTFQGRRGLTVTVDMTSTEIDPYLIVLAPSGTQQENDDISSADRNARVTWPLPADGVYTIVATSYRPSESGAYTVRLSLGAPAAVVATPGARPATPSARVQQVYAVLVGISDYGGRANNLPYTAEDATKLAQTLQREGVWGEGSVVLTDAEATHDRVQAAFEQVASRAGPDDVFLFFYSGHGTQLRENPSSPEADLRDEAIVLRDRLVTDDEMAEWFRDVHARMNILALDACFSGGFARDVVTRPGILGLFSSEEDLTSAVAGKFQAGGYLSHFLRMALAGEADLDPRDGTITAGELSTYLRRQFATQAANVEAETMDNQHNYQNLVIERGGVKIDDVVLALASR